jgi:hypothetical protein
MVVKYTIINAAEVNSIDFEQVAQTSIDTLRFCVDKSKTIVSFDGDTPSFLEGKTQYTHAEIKAIVSDVNGDWYTEINF